MIDTPLRLSFVDLDRRRFIGLGSAIGAAILAGCTGDDESDGAGTDSTVNGANFRLLISDAPADIGDFDRLDVSFSHARVFDGEGDDDEGANGGDDEATDATVDDDDTDNDDGADDEEAADQTGGENADEEDGVERRRGFYILDLDGETVDLTTVLGNRATPVFEGMLSAGTYQKLELHVKDVEGIVNGSEANVKVPSEKLQITHEFEVQADEQLDFVFDINVVKRGQGNDYNLTPVISESGVVGEDVEEVEEVEVE